MPCEGLGDVVLNIDSTRVTLTEVLLVPDVSCNLTSVSRMGDKGYFTIFGKEMCFVRNPQGKCIIRAPRVGSLYRVKCQISTFFNDADVCDPGPAVLCVSVPQDLCHRRLCHLSWQLMRKLQESEEVSGLDMGKIEDKPCGSCFMGKMSRKQFRKKKKTARSATQILELVHTDLMGPMRIPSYRGSRKQ